ncbi:MAG TPA: ribose 5-phosphate isomerase B [Gemmatimonadales bacterium]|nr:ribose 5-phosphate isomerase B [Gemmatimonadales bacterium]HEV8509484.1 ribose 5-phosphate isomerase B [Gemmatimonadales bacterium]
MAEKIYVGADHVGFNLKNRLVDELKRLGYEPIDVGPKQLDPADDYPDYAKPVASAVSSGVASRGVLTCGTGLGMSYTANRFPKVRAALAWNEQIAELSRLHGDSNLLVLPAQFVSEEQGVSILHKWLETRFDGGRHLRRVEKIDK